MKRHEHQQTRQKVLEKSGDEIANLVRKAPRVVGMDTDGLEENKPVKGHDKLPSQSLEPTTPMKSKWSQFLDPAAAIAADDESTSGNEEPNKRILTATKVMARVSDAAVLHQL
ncbi:hypothetical protein H4219_002482 [Mycoemilia scoparia]|uniref:Uncharacterized protein n=1 Tax=Mycoemilia scoparia TaxID=417184 RepID=A0A9W8A2C4_9FUNG|nr:hypothetical protein H4219_002482 [Mycoemilia scoparia]